MESESSTHTPLFARVGNSILIVLVVVALILIYFLYQKLHTGSTQSPDTASTALPPDVDTTSIPLSPDEQAVLQSPSSDAPMEARAAHFMLIQKIAVESGAITIGAGCRVSPVVLKTKMGSELTFKNKDNVPHTLTFSGASPYSVPAGQSITVPATFGTVAGIYGYVCDETGLAGFVWMEG
jgi:plastocyanin